MAAFLAALASSALAEIVYKLVVGFLQEYLKRKDLEDKIKLEIENDMLKLSAAASEWKASAAARADGGGDLRVQPGAGTVPLPGTDAGAHGSAR